MQIIIQNQITHFYMTVINMVMLPNIVRLSYPQYTIKILTEY